MARSSNSTLRSTSHLRAFLQVEQPAYDNTNGFDLAMRR